MMAHTTHGVPRAAEHARAIVAPTVGTTVSAPPVVPVAVTPTQLRRPWRSTTRTIFQATIALAAMWAVIVQTLGLPDWAWVGTSVAVAGGITRLMAVPQVELFLRQFLPWLAAAPKSASANELPNRIYGSGVTPRKGESEHGRVWPMVALVAICVALFVIVVWR